MLLDAAATRDAIGVLALVLLGIGLLATLVHYLSTFIVLLAAQGVVLACCAGLLALEQGNLHAYAALVLTIGVKVIGVPLVLILALRRVRQRREAESAISHKVAFVLAVGLVLLAYLVAGPIAHADTAIPPNALPVSVAMLLLGGFTMAVRTSALTQVVGLVMAENGVYLAALAVTRGLPLAVELGVGLDVLVGALVMGLVARQIDLRFTSIDTSNLRALRG